ncbi:uncharacterized protein PGTG_21768 [Puccinia graminis f. sp. tritici CRL 75-36-700-3]|uniref:Uncharacterized protein n=1 Tax=Puccinia graminis f. sp. tritici (strain CRL 75-36-700-3 / race SCCL) TaxID=418459 RepID=H6QSF4_PUCGT|nr:uncharacterized protein PGTG_21768 [Puccinia graminis f. sp. tritici CRL 75-36-700-3]EHS63682.1 hypothetical protein PGTG_21768 [Puccinia graminis f. sp. tritici CRL 75-36-700-3]
MTRGRAVSRESGGVIGGRVGNIDGRGRVEGGAGGGRAGGGFLVGQEPELELTALAMITQCLLSLRGGKCRCRSNFDLVARHLNLLGNVR